jgi:hypothetical protein
MKDVFLLPLTEEQIGIMRSLRVPLFDNYKDGNKYIAKRYWESIRPALQQALIRVLKEQE